MSEIQFVDGLIVKAPNEKAPDFVKMAISIKRSELISWLTTKTDDWINIDVKVSKAGKWYCAVNDFKPSKQDVTSATISQPAAQSTNTVDPEFDDIIPFS